MYEVNFSEPRMKFGVGIRTHMIFRLGQKRTAQPIRGKLRSYTNVFPRQVSVSTQYALPTRSQFPSPHRNHSGHTFSQLLIFKGMKYQGIKIIIKRQFLRRRNMESNSRAAAFEMNGKERTVGQKK